MPRFFNTAGPCNPRDHYMLASELRLPDVRRLIDQKLYFSIHAPRQVGKTTCFRNLAERLTAEGTYAALLTTCEAGQAAGSDLDRGITAVLQTLQQDADLRLPAALRPPAPNLDLDPTTRLRDLLIRWAQTAPRPVVLFLDEIDSLVDAVLISVLRQLRSGYPERPESFAQSVALIGLTASFFNINVESLTLRSFTAEEVAELYAQHTADTGQTFTPEACRLAWELTGGHPWLVNALARQAVERLAPDPGVTVTAAIVEAAASPI